MVSAALPHPEPLGPQQFAHAATHFNPFFLQEHCIVMHVFLDDDLHLHGTKFNNISGLQENQSGLECILALFHLISNPN